MLGQPVFGEVKFDMADKIFDIFSNEVGKLNGLVSLDLLHNCSVPERGKLQFPDEPVLYQQYDRAISIYVVIYSPVASSSGGVEDDPAGAADGVHHVSALLDLREHFSRNWWVEVAGLDNI